VSLNPTDLDAPLGRSLAALHAEVARAFAFFNERFWRGSLPTPIFAFFRQPPNGRRLGHYRPRSWRAPDGTLRDEIILYADLALEQGMSAVLETLLHEAVHVWQAQLGLPAGHNAQWHEEAARVGLVTEGPLGITSAGDGFLRAVVDFAPRVDLIPFRVREGGARKPGKLAKWICACGFGVRVAIADFDATCNRCGQTFHRSHPASASPKENR
jgi:hypothetical protein